MKTPFSVPVTLMMCGALLRFTCFLKALPCCCEVLIYIGNSVESLPNKFDRFMHGVGPITVYLGLSWHQLGIPRRQLLSLAINNFFIFRQKDLLPSTGARVHRNTRIPITIHLVASFASLAGLGFPSSFFFTDCSLPISSSGLAVAG